MNIDKLRIEVILAEQGISKAALADRCGVTPQNLYTIVKRGTCHPKTAGKIAAGLGVSVSDIITKEA